MRTPPWQRWIEWLRPRGRRWPEVPVLVALATVTALAWLFIELAEEVTSGDTRHFDNLVLTALRDPADPSLPIGPLWLVDAARDVTALGSTSVLCLVVVIVVGYLAIVRRPREIVVLLAAVATGLVLSASLKFAFDRPRPPAGSAVQRTHTTSFPSGHSFSSALVYLTLGAMLARVMPARKLRVYLIGVAIGLSVLIGLTRVYLGVHYPTDVLAGWAAGAGWAVLWWLVVRLTYPQQEAQAAA